MSKQLQKGAKGEDVKQLQLALNSRGFNVGIADGVFGAKTEDALKAFQKSLNIEATGVLGPWVAEQLKMSKLTIAITAGHNNKDPGAVNGARTEASVAVEVRNAVASGLRVKGFNILTDGEGNTNETLSSAAKLAKQADIAIEFHLNASANKTAKGVEALAPVKDKLLCQALCKATAEVLNTNVRGSDGGWKASNSGQHARLAFCEAGGIVMELFFISNDTELKAYDTNKDKLFAKLVQVISEHAEKKC